MSKADKLRELYNECKNITSEDSLNLILEANDDAEADFFMKVTDFMLQQKQKKVIAAKRF